MRGLGATVLLGCRSCHFGVRHASTSQFYDAVIVGGGMVGNAMACTLGLNPQLSSKRILLLEAGKPSPLPKSPPEFYSNRVSAVGPAAVHLFKKIAYIIENNAIVGALYDRIRNGCPTVEVKAEASVKNCRVLPSCFDLGVTKTGPAVKKLPDYQAFIGADGANSKVRQSMGVNYTAFKYNQSGVVATLVVEASGQNDVAWQRFCRAGPIAYLPLTSNLSSLVWTTSTEHAEQLLSLTKEEFVDELNRSMFREDDQNDFVNKSLFLLSKMPFVSEEIATSPVPPHVVTLQGDSRAAFPLGFGHSHTYVLPRCALTYLKEFDTSAQRHNLPVMVLCDWLNRLYRTNAAPIVMLRSLGLAAFNKLSPVKVRALTYLKEFDTSAQRHNLPVMVLCDWLNRLYRTNAAPIVMLRSLGLAAFNKLSPV
ncbi:ubiquinone biosynthesis hydroxylase, UbiH/UbiF/VisC/COQ6 family, partial [Ostertagia ostertagi]